MNKAHILICDDKEDFRTMINRVLSEEGYQCSESVDGRSALNLINNHNFDVLLLDLNMPGIDGIEVLEQLSQSQNSPKIIVITAYGDIPRAIKATRLGAFDFIEKPAETERILISIKNAVAESKLFQEASGFKKQLEHETRIIGNHPKTEDLRRTLQLIAKNHANILITGENGSGKDLAAKNIHFYSSRAHMPYHNLNCAAIPDTLIESKLFGHKKGSFTGADDFEGLFKKANGGTLFLNEIAEMSASAQAKLLQVIETGQFSAVGSNDIITVDVRIIAATNKDLSIAIKEKQFRQDLFYRLNVVEINIPPLRERHQDIVLIAEYLMEQKCLKNGIPLKKFTLDACNVLIGYTWPGNVRELSNLIERLIIFEQGEKLDRVHILTHLNVPERNVRYYPKAFREARSRWEKDFIMQALSENGNNITRTAKQLEIERAHLHKLINKYEINSHF